ncbi:hypothetical protein [Mangrovicella endophytica]|uniref:hypothetical protein n=1 Tax=Mangrovicella endophytica TaxID=2066697 RepID=UPI000C9DAFF7|nr:hypothetical protein [Mangrovicella endophytica]
MRPIADIAALHRPVLDGQGLLRRPWVILGGAPDPTLPAELRQSHARVDVNNSGLTALRNGWGEADLTIRRPVESWEVHPELQTRVLLWYSPRTRLRLRWKLLRQRRARVGTLISMTPDERESIVYHHVGEELRGIGDLGKPSTGIAGLCYGLFMGVPEIVLAGFSFSREGHSFDTLSRPRMQVPEDRFVLSKLAADPRVATSEPELAADLGLRLWQPRPGNEGGRIDHGIT